MKVGEKAAYFPLNDESHVNAVARGNARGSLGATRLVTLPIIYINHRILQLIHV
jgi:hypothetical protein